jgi:hypothetical protein
MLNVTNKRFTPNIVMLNVVMLSVVLLIVGMLSVVTLSVVMLNVVASIEQLGCHLIGPEMLDYDLNFKENTLAYCLTAKLQRKKLYCRGP